MSADVRWLKCWCGKPKNASRVQCDAHAPTLRRPRPYRTSFFKPRRPPPLGILEQAAVYERQVWLGCEKRCVKCRLMVSVVLFEKYGERRCALCRFDANSGRPRRPWGPRVTVSA